MFLGILHLRSHHLTIDVFAFQLLALEQMAPVCALIPAMLAEIAS